MVKQLTVYLFDARKQGGCAWETSGAPAAIGSVNFK